jgi:hypothetical protein
MSGLLAFCGAESKAGVYLNFGWSADFRIRGGHACGPPTWGHYGGGWRGGYRGNFGYYRGGWGGYYGPSYRPYYGGYYPGYPVAYVSPIYGATLYRVPAYPDWHFQQTGRTWVR